ncbi:MAG: MFS transporter [bacterium]
MSPFGERLFPLWLVGLMIGLAALCQLLLDIPAGYMLDRYGYRRMLKATTLFFMAAVVCLLFGLSKISFVLSLVASIFGWLFFGPGISAYSVNQSAKGSVSMFLSSRDVFASVGIVLASVVVPFIVLLDVRLIAVLMLIIFLGAYILISIAPKENPINTGRVIHLAEHNPYRLKKNFLSNAYREVMRLRPASLMLLSLSLSAATFYGIVWFVVPLLIAHQAESGLLGVGLSIFDFSVVVLGFVLGKMVDMFNKKLLVFSGLLVFSIAAICIGFNFGPLFLLLGFLATAGDELSGLSLWSWLYGIDKKHENYGLVSGTISLFEDFGWTLGPILGGILYGIVGPTWTIVVGGIIILSNLIIFACISKKPISLEISVSSPVRLHRRRYKH